MGTLQAQLQGLAGVVWHGEAPTSLNADELWRWVARMSTVPVQVVPDVDPTVALADILVEVLRDAGVPSVPARGYLAVCGVDRGALHGIGIESAAALASLLALAKDGALLLVVPHPEGGHVAVAVDTEEWDRRLFARRLP